MNNLKIDFTKDYITGDKIPLNEFRNKLKEETKNKNKNFYLSEIADFYYKKKYNKNILQILNDFFDIPKCPIKNDVVSYKLCGNIIFGKYSSNCSYEEISQHIAKNNENFKKSVEKTKIERIGNGNPMFGKTPWNKGLDINSSESLKRAGENRKGRKHSVSSKNKQSESAKNRKIHGHTGMKHSEESKQKMREKTISRFKNGLFPKTKSVPHNIFKSILDEQKINYEEEFGYGKYSFDFILFDYNLLIEIQGDYFHCNPNTRHKEAKSSVQIKNVNRDVRKKNFILNENKYNFEEIWEFDLINNKEKIEKWIKDLKN